MKTLPRLQSGWQQRAIAKGWLTEADLREAESRAQATHTDVVSILQQAGKLTDELIARLHAEASGLLYVDVLDYQVDPNVLELVPEPVARKHTLLPLYRIGNSLTVAMHDPLNFFAVDDLRLKTKCEVKTVVASETGIRQAIGQHYGAAGAKREVAHAIEEAALPKPDDEAAGEAPVIRLVDLLIVQAAK